MAVIPLVGKEIWHKVFVPCPRWARHTLIVFAAYAPVNFVIFFAHSEGGAPDMRDGVYVLRKGGSAIRELTEQKNTGDSRHMCCGASPDTG